MPKPISHTATSTSLPATLSVSDAAGEGPNTDSLFWSLPWGVVVLDGQGTVLRLNRQATHWWGISPQVLRGQTLGPANVGTLPADLHQALRQVAEGSPQPREFFLSQHQQWIAMSSAREADAWVVYWQDITAQRSSAQQTHPEKRPGQPQEETKPAAEPSPDIYVTLYNSMNEGFCIVEVLFDAAQHPVDYRFLHVNPAFEKQTGLQDARGKTMRELAPTHEQYWFDIYGRVARTSEPTRFEAQGESLGRWFDVNAFPVGGGATAARGRPHHRHHRTQADGKRPARIRATVSLARHGHG